MNAQAKITPSCDELSPTQAYAVSDKGQEHLFKLSHKLGAICHQLAVDGGWWNDPATGAPLQRNVGELLMLCTSELSEAMEADRKDLMDDKLPQRKGLEVELADAVIRVFDMAGGLNLDIAGAIAEKIKFNISREDHKPTNRANGGKKY